MDESNVNWQQTLQPLPPSFVASPANGSWVGPWIPAGPENHATGILACTRTATIVIEASNDQQAILATATAAGSGYVLTAPITNGPYRFYRVRYTNGGTADTNPIVVGMNTVLAVVESVGAGTNVTVNNADPLNPIVSATGGGGGGLPSDWVVNEPAEIDGASGSLLRLGGASSALVLGPNGGADVNAAILAGVLGAQLALYGNGNGIVEIRSMTDQSFVHVHAETGQTTPIIEVKEEGGTVVFDVGPAGMLSRLLPLGKVTAATPYGNPGLYAPSSTVPQDGGWIDIDLSAGIALSSHAVGDLTDPKAAVADLFAQATRVALDMYGWAGGENANSHLELNLADVTVGAVLIMRPIVGQTGPVVNLKNEAGTTSFAVTPTGALDLTEQADPANPAANIARLYSRDDGAAHTQLVVKFSDGGTVVIATDGGTLGPIAEGNQTAYNQTAFPTTLATVPAAVNVGALVLLSDVITAVGTLQTGINDNRKLINRLIDDLQAATLAR